MLLTDLPNDVVALIFHQFGNDHYNDAQSFINLAATCKKLHKIAYIDCSDIYFKLIAICLTLWPDDLRKTSFEIAQTLASKAAASRGVRYEPRRLSTDGRRNSEAKLQRPSFELDAFTLRFHELNSPSTDAPKIMEALELFSSNCGFKLDSIIAIQLYKCNFDLDGFLTMLNKLKNAWDIDIMDSQLCIRESTATRLSRSLRRVRLLGEQGYCNDKFLLQIANHLPTYELMVYEKIVFGDDIAPKYSLPSGSLPDDQQLTKYPNEEFVTASMVDLFFRKQQSVCRKFGCELKDLGRFIDLVLNKGYDVKIVSDDYVRDHSCLVCSNKYKAGEEHELTMAHYREHGKGCYCDYCKKDGLGRQEAAFNICADVRNKFRLTWPKYNR